MMASIPARNAYADSTLKPAMGPEALAEIGRLEAAGDYENPRYMRLVIPHFYEKHMLRIPVGAWPEPMRRSIRHWNQAISERILGLSALSLGGMLADWDRTADLGRLEVPTLIIGATHDIDDPAHMTWMAGQVQYGRYLHCPDGSHLALYDDPQPYFEGLVRFITDVDAGRV
jgi:proline iminopeptidase